MIASLSGTIHHLSSHRCILLVNGVGYEIELPLRTKQLLAPDQEVEFFIHTYVREDQLKLFGFETILERDLFTTLLSISGVGPKAALSILSSGTVDSIQKAISTADVKFFTKIKGLGKKTAQKIIIELKEKLGSLEELDLNENSQDKLPQEVVDALIDFGFPKKEIIVVLEKLDQTQSESQLIKLALQQLGKV